MARQTFVRESSLTDGFIESFQSSARFVSHTFSQSVHIHPRHHDEKESSLIRPLPHPSPVLSISLWAASYLPVSPSLHGPLTCQPVYHISAVGWKWAGTAIMSFPFVQASPPSIYLVLLSCV